MLRLRTIGRRTGEERSAILGYFEDGPNLVTLAMNGWAEGEPAWWLNLQAHPDATVDLVGGPRKVRARAAWATSAIASGPGGATSGTTSTPTRRCVRPGRRSWSWSHGQIAVEMLMAGGPARGRERRDEYELNDRRSSGKPGMSADRKAAVWIGVLYIIGTVALVLSVVVAGAVLTGPELPGPGRRAAEPGGHRSPARPAGGLRARMVPVVFWPIGKRYNETLAIGYVVFRGAIETVLYIASALGYLLLITLSTEPGAAPLAGLVRTAETVVRTSCSPSRSFSAR